VKSASARQLFQSGAVAWPLSTTQEKGGKKENCIGPKGTSRKGRVRERLCGRTLEGEGEKGDGLYCIPLVCCNAFLRP